MIQKKKVEGLGAEAVHTIFGIVRGLAVAAGLLVFSSYAVAYLLNAEDWLEYSYNESSRVVYGPGEKPRFDTRRIMKKPAYFKWLETMYCKKIGTDRWRHVGASPSEKDHREATPDKLNKWKNSGYPWFGDIDMKDPALCYVESETSVVFWFGAIIHGETHRTAIFVLNWPGIIE